MDLYLIRHAIAVERVEGEDDATRSLTSRGERRFRRVVRGLGRLEVGFDRVHHSPWRRAVETASLLAPLIDGPAHATELLAAPPGLELLAVLGDGRGTRLAVVGHEPWLGELCALLTCGDPRHGEHLPLRKGGVAWLSGTVAAGGMTLRALLPPKVLRSIGAQ